MRSPTPWFVQLALAIGLILLAGCSSDGPVDPDDGIHQLTLPASEAMCGAVLELGRLEKLDIDSPTEALDVRVDDHPGALLRRTDGSYAMIVPLFLGPDALWPEPPAGPVSVEILEGDRVIASSGPVLSLEEPAQSPGSAQSYILDLASWLGQIESIFDAMPLSPGAPDAYADVAIAAVREIVDGDDELSLAALLAGLSPDELRLFDAVLHASELDLRIRELTMSFDGLTTRMGEPTLPRVAFDDVMCGTVWADSSLADLMQFAAFAHLYGTEFISETAGTLSGASGAFGLVLLAAFAQDVPVIGELLGLINFAVGLTDILVNKLLVALLPSRVASIDLQLAQSSLSPGSLTSSYVTLCATNDPPPLTINDVVSQIINAAAVVSPGGSQTLREGIEEIALFLLDRINAGLAAYNEIYPDVVLNIELIEVPPMRWSTVITNPRWIALLSGSPGVATHQAGTKEWMAIAPGSTSLSVIPSTSTDALFSGAYDGGAFGDDITPSNSVQIDVSDLVLDVIFPEAILSPGPAPLTVTAGRQIGEDIVWGAGWSVSLSVTGGVAQEYSGTTDAGGGFQTSITPHADTETVTVEVTVSDDLGVQRTAVVSSDYAPVGVAFTGRRSVIYIVVSDSDGQNSCENQDFAEYEEPGLWTENFQMPCTFEGVTMGSYQRSDVQGADIDPGMPQPLRIEYEGRASYDGRVGYSAGGSHRVHANNGFNVSFHVLEDGLRLTGQVEIDEPNSLAAGTFAVHDVLMNETVATWDDDTDGPVAVDIPLLAGHYYSVSATVAYDARSYAPAAAATARTKYTVSVIGGSGKVVVNY